MKYIQRYRRMCLQISHLGGPYCSWIEPVDSFGRSIVARRIENSFKRGVHVRVKNKGAQAHKKGRKRPTYQSPWKEHPATARIIAETDIHANHAEAFWSALRRKCATFRRKTNMYAKATTGLQRLLRVYWVVHNFLL